MLVRPTETALFIGPSLPSGELAARLTTPVRLFPPVRCGDLDRLGPEVCRVAIVDGVFLSERAVTPREVLAALRRGVQVWGAASMGALRAAELRTYGMRGIGEIYRRYADGLIESDAEVALIFDPETGRALTQPLVSIRRMIELAEEDGVLDGEQARLLLERVRGIPYPELTYPSMLAATLSLLPVTTGRSWLAFVASHQEQADLKRADALLLLDLLNQADEPFPARGAREP